MKKFQIANSNSHFTEKKYLHTQSDSLCCGGWEGTEFENKNLNFSSQHILWNRFMFIFLTLVPSTCGGSMVRCVMGKCYENNKMTKEWEVTEGRKRKYSMRKDKKRLELDKEFFYVFFDNLFTPPASMDQSEILIFPSIVNITYCSSSKWYAVCCCLVGLEMETLFFMCFNRKKNNLWNFFHSRKDNKISVDRGERALYKVIHHHPYPNGFKHTREK